MGEHSKARASVGEPHQFWLMPYSTLYVDGNYCVSDKFSQANDECKIVVASDARFFNRGNTFMPSQKKTNLYLGSRSVFIVQGNFGNKRTTLHISQDSYIFFTVAITEFSVQILTNDFDTRACAFSSTGSCPNNLVYLR